MMKGLSEMTAFFINVWFLSTFRLNIQILHSG